MGSHSIHPPLSNIQSELLKLFAADIPEQNLLELKDIIARYLSDTARDKADAIWDKNGFTDDELEKRLNHL